MRLHIKSGRLYFYFFSPSLLLQQVIRVYSLPDGTFSSDDDDDDDEEEEEEVEGEYCEV